MGGASWASFRSSCPLANAASPTNKHPPTPSTEIPAITSSTTVSVDGPLDRGAAYGGCVYGCVYGGCAYGCAYVEGA